jgi:hypothetical protein
MVALSAVLGTATRKMNRRICPEWAKLRAPPARRCASHPPINASSVFPMAMTIETPKDEPGVVQLTASAPTNTAGQTLNPSNSTAASARPVGGQTGDALACKNASESPNLPAAK